MECNDVLQKNFSVSQTFRGIIRKDTAKTHPDNTEKLPDIYMREDSKKKWGKKKEVCLELLNKKLYMSFLELSTLSKIHKLHSQENTNVLNDDFAKKELIGKYLTCAEKSFLKSDYRSYFNAQKFLADHFEKYGENYLATHFQSNCISCEEQFLKKDNEFSAANHYSAGIYLEKSGNYTKAAHHFEEYYKLISLRENNDNKDKETVKMEACKQLAKSYLLAAGEKRSRQEMKNLLLKARDLAQAVSNNFLLAEIYYKLGLFYNQVLQPNEAIECLHSYLSLCETNGDEKAIGRCYYALSQSYEKLGDHTNSQLFLERVIKMPVGILHKDTIGNAYSDYGMKLFVSGSIQPAIEYFIKGYNIVGDTRYDGENLLWTCMGIGQAFSFQEKLFNAINKKNVKKLIEWKSFKNGL